MHVRKSNTASRFTGKFWKLLGAATDKNQSQSLALVDASKKYDEKAKDLTDEQLTKAAKKLDLTEGLESKDIGQFLAIVREAAERTMTSAHSTFSCWVRCACWTATSSRWPRVRARP